MFSSKNKRSVRIQLGDPGADDKQFHVHKAPVSQEITAAYIVCQTAQGAGSAGAFTLLNYGTAGTAVSGTISASKGGTAVEDRLGALTPAAFSITEGTLAEGEWVVLDYQETGDFVEGAVTVVLEVVDGIAA